MKIGVDIGGTKIIGGYHDSSGQLVLSAKVQTPAGQKEGLAAVCELIESLAGAKRVSLISLSCPGPLDFEQGIMLHPVNLEWGDVPIVQHLRRHFSDARVLLENDAKAAAWAEYKSGAGQGAKALLYVTISTGIGTALILDGHIYHGAHDTEGGKMLQRDATGHLDSLEDTVSGRAIRRRFGKPAYEITDPDTWNTIAADTALGLINLIDMLSPDRVVLGGGVMVHYQKFQAELYRQLGLMNRAYPLPPVVPAEHIETAAVLGAVLLAERS